LTGRSGGQRNREQHTHTHTHTHTHNSSFRNNRISFLVVLVLLFQHPVLVLVFKQELCLSQVIGATRQFFFLSFSDSCLVSYSLSEVWLVLRFQRSGLWPTNCPSLELCFCCVGLLEACFFALYPFSEARSEICQLTLCCQRVMLVF
jgi:hypothetical protein